LTLEGIVVNKHRPKHNFTQRDRTRLLLTLWTQDDLIYIPERYRVQTTFIIHAYCWTGARIGAFFTDGLRYKVTPSSLPVHFTLTVPGCCSCPAARDRPKLEAHLQDLPTPGEEQPGSREHRVRPSQPLASLSSSPTFRSPPMLIRFFPFQVWGCSEGT
jgi:hypothetical protein